MREGMGFPFAQVARAMTPPGVAGEATGGAGVDGATGGSQMGPGQCAVRLVVLVAHPPSSSNVPPRKHRRVDWVPMVAVRAGSRRHALIGMRSVRAEVYD